MPFGSDPVTQQTDPVFPKQSAGQDAKKGNDKGQPKMEEGRDVEMASEEYRPKKQQPSPCMKEVHICVCVKGLLTYHIMILSYTTLLIPNSIMDVTHVFCRLPCILTQILRHCQLIHDRQNRAPERMPKKATAKEDLKWKQ